MAAVGRRIDMKAKALVSLKHGGVWYEPGSTVDLKGLSEEEIKHLEAIGAIRLEASSASRETTEVAKASNAGRKKVKRGK